MTIKRDLFADVTEFHKKFELPSLPSPGMLDVQTYVFRKEFMREELSEFSEAYRAGDLHGAFDALVDLVYVALGTAYMMGLPFNEGWAAVHTANMAKVRATSEEQSKRGSSLDVVKPEGWQAPNLWPALVEAGASEPDQSTKQ